MKDRSCIDPFNGLLLSPTLDKLFDRGYISFTVGGSLIISPLLNNQDIDQLGIGTSMDLVLNKNRDNHRQRLVRLITKSDQIVLCSGWLKYAGLKKLLPAMKTAIARKNVEITVYSNCRHTEPKCVEALKELQGIKHIIVDADTKYLHTKLYYFACTTHYTVIIGSANLTQGGLVQNDELSVELCGELGDDSHQKLTGYLERLSRYESY